MIEKVCKYKELLKSRIETSLHKDKLTPAETTELMRMVEYYNQLAMFKKNISHKDDEPFDAFAFAVEHTTEVVEE